MNRRSRNVQRYIPPPPAADETWIRENAIYSTATLSADGHARTFKEAIDEFARTHWAAPRKAIIREDGRSFTMKGGTGRIYRVDTYRTAEGWRAYAITVQEEGGGK